MSNKKTAIKRLPEQEVLLLALFGDKTERRYANRTLKNYDKRGRNKRAR